ncbi:mismatch repair ATPase MLH1 [Rhizophagus irregularis DAOM 197198w]|uniref:Mismatch repair ATPase MLH1 n=1 Tax=Rhizophagus irregularis (strain DAOM 197198w) TaxID=1432141 RepID=A0A015LJ66_RHIIW|nr:mismatch repair ATPase MLH1 [Rhizophagus irregularis DAOM 197198w]
MNSYHLHEKDALTMTDKTNPRPIRRLNETVVNRIAAGEELIENSLDAGASNIQITVKDGGLKLLQILDNGHGIRKEDMTIVCERFTTSKLKNFEDLSNINTYGFRGEALASISHVAHVTITTKTADSNCAYRACYSDGKLVPAKPGTNAEPKACAGNTGTQITAEDLFYNVPTRRKALKSPSDEYNRILDVVNRYAIHNSGVSFTCKKQGSNQAEVNTLSMSSVLDNIRQIYGSIASELLGLSKSFKKLEFKLNGYISNANYNLKKMIFLLFINHRAVENSSLKKAIESIYTTYLPKNTHPFAYLSLEINPQNVDVNVHPTKREVRFLNEDEVIAAVGDAIQESLAGANSSRTFLTQTLLPGAESIETNTNLAENSIKKSGNYKCVKVLNYKLVRTDSRVQTLDDFCNPDNTFNMQPKDNPKKGNNNFPNSSKNIVNSNVGSSNLKRKRERFDVRLTSILTLRKRLKEIEHKGLTELLANHTFVGCVDDSLTLALVQHQTKLYMVNYNVLSEELFYQLALYGFHNFGFIHLSIPAPIRELTIFALESCDHDKSEDLKPNEEISQIIIDQLISRKEMLLEYFSMTITENGELATLPLMLKGYAPNLDKLPTFLLRLGTEVDWETETGCFETLSRELGLFYAPEPPNFSNISTSISNNQDDNSMDICDTSNVNKDNSLLLPKRKSSEKETNLIFTEQQKKAEIARYKWQIEHLIFPTLKSQFIAPKSIAENGHVLQIANLPDLYRIFERC